ncbi:MAG TPA: WGxxGxxG family protein [Coleofasciculaceae cyanobacterium]
MKLSNFSRLFSAAVLTASLSVMPLALSAKAQTGDSGTYTQSQETVAVEDDNDTDWGWLGLLGLLGLAGLLGKKRRATPDAVHTDRVSREPDVVVRDRTDYRS